MTGLRGRCREGNDDERPERAEDAPTQYAGGKTSSSTGIVQYAASRWFVSRRRGGGIRARGRGDLGSAAPEVDCRYFARLPLSHPPANPLPARRAPPLSARASFLSFIRARPPPPLLVAGSHSSCFAQWLGLRLAHLGTAPSHAPPPPPCAPSPPRRSPTLTASSSSRSAHVTAFRTRKPSSTRLSRSSSSSGSSRRA